MISYRIWRPRADITTSTFRSHSRCPLPSPTHCFTGPGVYDFSSRRHVFLLNHFPKEMNIFNHAVQHAPTGIVPAFLDGWPHRPSLPNEPATEALRRLVSRCCPIHTLTWFGWSQVLPVEPSGLHTRIGRPSPRLPSNTRTLLLQ